MSTNLRWGGHPAVETVNYYEIQFFFKPCQVFFCIFERKIDITFQPSHVMTVINQKRKTTRFNEAKCGLLNRLTTSMADDFIQVELWLQD